MSDQGEALMGIGMGTGDNRASDAATMAINSPLLERSIDGAKGIIINITGNEDLGLFEINEASQIITEAADPDANIISGNMSIRHLIMIPLKLRLLQQDLKKEQKLRQEPVRLEAAFIHPVLRFLNF